MYIAFPQVGFDHPAIRFVMPSDIVDDETESQAAERIAQELNGIVVDELLPGPQEWWRIANGGLVVVLPDVPPPSPTDVIAERERRLALGFDFDFGDARGVHHMDTTPEDMRKWMDEVTPLAQAYLNLGQPGGEILISTGSGAVTITALEWQQILLAASTWRQPIYQASFALQAMDPIPADFAEDNHWPV
ncbi:MAG: hypothetical protein J0I23_28545 [Rhizobiales bacterium]|nr:hypothetical protein [Hyphomicrobiales bacterium]